jgi:3-keto-5-aminohexanoate cleavage enzyme
VTSFSKLILNLAPTGMVPTRDMSKCVPLTPAEIIADAVAAAALGVSIVHIHARDETGQPTYRKEIYARIIGGIREKCPDLIICVSLSGRSHGGFEERSDPLLLKGDLAPDMASLTLSSLNFARVQSMNSPEMIQRLAETMADNGIKPELEAFDVGMVNYAAYLADRQIIQPPFYFNFLLGNVSSAQARPAHLALMMSELPPDSYWCGAGLGAQQLDANMLGMMFGNGVRVGLEDYLWLDAERRMPASNEDMVRRVVDIARLLGRTFATPGEVRSLLGLRNAG